jgi:tetratricopeptide (TPR) repeat protein
MSRRKLGYLLAALFAAVLAAAGAWWYHVVMQPDYQLRRGEEALDQGDYRRAERVIRRLETSGYAAHAHLLRGELLLRRNDTLRALAEFRQVPREAEELSLRAAALYAEAALPINRYEAERAFLYVLSKRNDDVAAHRGLARIYHEQRAMSCERRHLLELTRLDPDDGRPYVYLAQIDMAYEEYDNGRDHLEQALERTLDPRDAEMARQDLAHCLFQRRDYDGVFKVLDSCQPATRQNAEMQRLQVESLQAKAEGAAARELLDRALADHARDLSLLRLRARFHLADQQPAEAAALLQKALEIDPYDRECHHELGNAYQRLGQRERAETEFRRAKEIGDRLRAIDRLGHDVLNNPWDAGVRRRLASQLREIGQEEAAREWERSAAACPPMPDAPIK